MTQTHAVNVFTIEDIDDVFLEDRDDPDWLWHDVPWEFYSPKAIAARQRRWQGMDVDAEPSHFDDAYVLPYVQPAPKTGRSNRCPCGSGKKYKRCCLATDEAAALPHTRLSP